MPATFKIEATFDDEAGVWYTSDSELFGVNAEGATLDELVAKLPAVISDLAEDNDWPADLLIEVTAHTTTRVLAAA